LVATGAISAHRLPYAVKTKSDASAAAWQPAPQVASLPCKDVLGTKLSDAGS